MGTVSAQRPRWSGYSQPRRPERPQPGCRYPGLDRIIAERSAVWGDGRDARDALHNFGTAHLTESPGREG
jgi:hypothetical protein